MTKDQLIEKLVLKPHAEGGWFRRTYTSPARTGTNDERAAMSSIFYLMSSDQPPAYMHRNQSDIMHYWHQGGAIKYTLVTESGDVREQVLGPDLDAGEQLQLWVPGGCWKASELISGDFCLISEAVCPGFDYDDHEFARRADFSDYPELAARCIA